MKKMVQLTLYKYLWGEFMKPIIIYSKDELIKLTKEEFEKYIMDAYTAGRQEGYAEGVASCSQYKW